MNYFQMRYIGGFRVVIQDLIRTHDDPLEISRGFLAVIKGFKVMMVWSKSSEYENPGDQKEIIKLANEYFFLNTSKGDGYKNISLGTLKKKFQTFNKIYKYQGKIIEIREGEVITFNAFQNMLSLILKIIR